MAEAVVPAEAAENFKRKIPSVKITDFDISPCVFKGRFFNNTNGNIVGADIIRPSGLMKTKRAADCRPYIMM